MTKLTQNKDDYLYMSKEFSGKYMEVEAELIYQDGELNEVQAIANAMDHIFNIGDWVIMERMDEDG